jgi:hypothetical protein
MGVRCQDNPVATGFETKKQVVGGIQGVGQRLLRHEDVYEVSLERPQISHFGESGLLEGLPDASEQLMTSGAF